MRKIVPAMSALAAAMALLVGCHPAGQEASSATNRLAAATDRLADASDSWGDKASNRIDTAGEGVSRHIASANDRLAAIVDPARTDAWVGRWRGKEGLSLVIAKDEGKGAGHYILTDHYGLEDRGVFHGVAVGDTIRFERPDGEHWLKATDGRATGLKPLAGKMDCLTVKPGEAYCRA